MFKNENLSVIAFANGFTVWHYVDRSMKFEDINEKFFSSIYHLCAVGDKFLLSLENYYAEVVVVKLSNKCIYFKELCKVKYEEDSDE